MTIICLAAVRAQRESAKAERAEQQRLATLLAEVLSIMTSNERTERNWTFGDATLQLPAAAASQNILVAIGGLVAAVALAGGIMQAQALKDDLQRPMPNSQIAAANPAP